MHLLALKVRTIFLFYGIHKLHACLLYVGFCDVLIAYYEMRIVDPLLSICLNHIYNIGNWLYYWFELHWPLNLLWALFPFNAPVNYCVLKKKKAITYEINMSTAREKHNPWTLLRLKWALRNHVTVCNYQKHILIKILLKWDYHACLRLLHVPINDTVEWVVLVLSHVSRHHIQAANRYELFPTHTSQCSQALTHINSSPPGQADVRALQRARFSPPLQWTSRLAAVGWDDRKENPGTAVGSFHSTEEKLGHYFCEPGGSAGLLVDCAAGDQ